MPEDGQRSTVADEFSVLQLYAIDPDYAKSIYGLLPKHDGYTIDEVAEGSKTAHLVNKDPAFMSPDKDSNFMGMPFKKNVTTGKQVSAGH